MCSLQILYSKEYYHFIFVSFLRIQLIKGNPFKFHIIQLSTECECDLRPLGGAALLHQALVGDGEGYLADLGEVGWAGRSGVSCIMSKIQLW